MIVTIDIQSVFGNMTGVGRYTLALIDQLIAQNPGNEIRCPYFDFRRRRNPLPVLREQQRPISWIPNRALQYAWKRLNWPSYHWLTGSADVFHFPNFIIPPLSKGKAIVTIHDTVFLRHPGTVEENNLRLLQQAMQYTVERADAIITNSQFTASEVEHYLQVPREKLHPIHLGLNEHMQRPEPGQADQVLRKLGLSSPYILFVSTIEPRKNIPFLIDVFDQLASFPGKLVIAGQKGWKYESIFQHMERARRKDDIVVLDYVQEQDLPALYRAASLFAFPSLYEGFGFPPLEAMACGTPVITSAAGSLPEVLGDAAIIIDSFDVARWCACIEQVLNTPEQQEALIQKGYEQSQKYTWRETAKKTWAVYTQVLSQS